MLESGEFRDWVEKHGGFPFDIDQNRFYCWEGVEKALSDTMWD